MVNYSDKVQALKNLLASESDFGKVFHHFFDHLGNDPVFLDAGKLTKNQRLKAIIKVAVSNAFKEEMKLTNVMLIRVAKEQFYHGTFFLDGRMSSVLYFEDLDMGMLAITPPMLLSGDTHFIRFTSTTIDPSKAGNFVGGESKRLQ